MKRILVTLIVGIVLFGTQFTFGQTPDPIWNYGNTMGISGSHNFKTSSWNTTGEVCIVCHTPHNAYLDPVSGLTAEPLWNHMITTQTFQLYSSNTLKATVGQPDGNSKLCLSCHDGVTIESNFNGITTGTSHFSATSGINIGSNTNRWTASNQGLADDHPISFTYDANLATLNPNLNDPTVTLSGLPGSSGTITTDLLFNGELQCCSCHDPHNNYAPNSHEPLLRNSNAGSAFCLTCHKN